MGRLRTRRNAEVALGIVPVSDEELTTLKALIAAYDELKESRLSAIESQEDALLELALQVQHFKDSFGMSWRELNRAFGFPHADTAIYRLLNRQGEFTDRAYGKIASGLNKALEDAGEAPFEARVWVNWKVGL